MERQLKTFFLFIFLLCYVVLSDVLGADLIVESANNKNVIYLINCSEPGLGAYYLVLSYEPKNAEIINVSPAFLGDYNIINGSILIAGVQGNVPGPTGDIKLAEIVSNRGININVVSVYLKDVYGNPIIVSGVGNSLQENMTSNGQMLYSNRSQLRGQDNQTLSVSDHTIGEVTRNSSGKPDTVSTLDVKQDDFNSSRTLVIHNGSFSEKNRTEKNDVGGFNGSGTIRDTGNKTSSTPVSVKTQKDTETEKVPKKAIPVDVLSLICGVPISFILYSLVFREKHKR